MNALSLKKLKPILHLEYPKVPAVDNINNVGESVLIKQLPKVEPEWDKPRNTAQTELMEAMHNLHMAKNHLEVVRGSKLLRKLDNQWLIIIKKKNVLRDSFVKFNKFVRENKEKRERAEKKLVEERTVVLQRLENLRELQSTFAYLYDIKHTMEVKIKELKIYEDFLVSVSKISGNQYKSVNDVIMRFEALQENKNELVIKQKEKMCSLEELNVAMTDLINAKNMSIVGHINKINELANRYDRAKTESLKWEAAVGHVTQLCIDKTNDIDNIKISCRYMYTSMCKRADVEPIPSPDRNDFAKQMLYIKRNFNILKRVGRNVRGLSLQVDTDKHSKDKNRPTKKMTIVSI